MKAIVANHPIECFEKDGSPFVLRIGAAGSFPDDQAGILLERPVNYVEHSPKGPKMFARPASDEESIGALELTLF
jgi:hypothetical protein